MTDSTYLALSKLCVTFMMLVTSVRGSSPALNQPSHLLFSLTVETQLIPQTNDLAARALHLLGMECGKLSECFSEAESLQDIPPLKDFPSEGILEKEGSKVFTKHLLKETYWNFRKLEMLLKMVQDDSHLIRDLVENMSRTRKQLKQELESHFSVNLNNRTYKSLLRTKTRYLKSTSATDRQYLVRLLYSSYTRLQKISHVLGYTVKLSWVALENNEWFVTSRSTSSPV